jgi:hypothetical protein
MALFVGIPCLAIHRKTGIVFHCDSIAAMRKSLRCCGPTLRNKLDPKEYPDLYATQGDYFVCREENYHKVKPKIEKEINNS